MNNTFFVVFPQALETSMNFNVWFQKISMPPPPRHGRDRIFQGGGGGSICLIFQWGGGITIGKYFQRVFVECS